MNRFLGSKILVNESISGSCVTDGCRNLVSASNNSRCLNLHSRSEQPDLIIIAMGVNDFSYNAPLDLFKESYSEMLSRIIAKYRDSKILCITPWFTMRGDFKGAEKECRVNNLGYSSIQYASVIEELAEQYGIYCFNAAETGFNEKNYYPTYCCDNKIHPTHPNRLGHRIMGEKIAQFIQKNNVLRK